MRRGLGRPRAWRRAASAISVPPGSVVARPARPAVAAVRARNSRRRSWASVSGSSMEETTQPRARTCAILGGMPLPAFEAIVAQLDYPMFIVTAAAGEERGGCLVGFATQASID